MYQKYLPSQIFTALFFNCVFFKFSSKKTYWLRNICYCLCNWNFTWWKGESSSFDTTLMRKLLLVCLQLEKFSKQKFSMTNKRFYSFTFYVYCIFWEAYFHDYIKSDDGYFMANHSGCGEWYHKTGMNIQVKAFWDEKYHMQWKGSVCRK